MDDRPLLTVLIDTYNYARFIEEAVESVLSQDYPMERVQVLVVDDGSTDDTSEWVKEYGPRIEYFYKANEGQASALNAGFARAHGEIVVLLDADDYFLPGKLRRVAEEFRRRPDSGMVYNALGCVHGSGRGDSRGLFGLPSARAEFEGSHGRFGAVGKTDVFLIEAVICGSGENMVREVG